VSQYPEVQKKMQAEIDRVLGTRDLPTCVRGSRRRPHVQTDTLMGAHDVCVRVRTALRTCTSCTM
jgi:hypothetical protein